MTFNHNLSRRLVILLVASSSIFANISTAQASHTFSALKRRGLRVTAFRGQNVEQQSSEPTSSASTNNVATASFQIIPAAINLVKEYEGFRSNAYLDTSGLPVIGYGQTKINGQTVTMGQYVTQAQADLNLEQELNHIQRLVLDHVKVKLNPHQLGALTSLVYNAGTRVVTQSTLIRKLNAGDYLGAAQEFPRWNKANQGGQLVALPGLTKRRLEEQKLFLTPPF